MATTDYAALARRVAAESPPLGEYPRSGLRPNKSTRQNIRGCGWPTATVTIEVTHPASVDARGWHRPARVQVCDVSIVPEAWLRRYADLLGLRLSAVCDGRYSEDAP